MKTAEEIISDLGGLTKTAAILTTETKRMPISTVQGWKDRNKIPPEYWRTLIDAARALGKQLSAEDFLPKTEAAE